MHLSTRSKIFIATVILSIIYVSLQLKIIIPQFTNSLILNTYYIGLIFGLITLMLTVWSTSVPLKFNRIFVAAMLPVMYSTFITIFSILSLHESLSSIRGSLLSIILITIYFIGTYFLLLNSNLLNISLVTSIPLERASKTAQYISSVLISYLSLYTIVASNLDWYIKIALLSISIYIFNYQLIWFNNFNKIHKIKLINTLSILIIILCFALLTWPITPQNYSLIIAIISYVIWGIYLENHDKLNGSTWLEYIALISLGLFFIISSATWGIFGHLF